MRLLYGRMGLIMGLALPLLQTVPLYAAPAASPIPDKQRAEAQALKNPLTDAPKAIADGEILYFGKPKCASCHGLNGHGNGPLAKTLNPPPRDFHQGGFWQSRTDGELFWVIKNGITGSAMPAFKSTLKDEQIWSLVSYLHTFAEHGRKQ